MRLTSFTDYCLRVLIYVSVSPAGMRATVPEIAQSFDISRSHLTKVVHYLGKSGVLRNVRGRGGGLELARPATEVNIGAVVRAAEADDALVECFNRATNHCVITRVCGLRGALRAANEAFYATLDGYCLADIAANRGPLANVLIFHRRRTVAG